ncbi:HtaA domain-containing protein [Streptomyces sp. WZ-12]|uniref:HtaA domain-containing protein n=1 Tax=Streptomyces sp. WZ-12 TaxID=3030210 RepID=UPI0023813C78|nr:HtaA domain-containing protein [Streptomyces sp. WZ-12]
MSVIRRPLVLAAALVTVAGSAVLGLPAAALAAPSAGSGAPSIALKDGTLDWGVKESFRRYVTGLALGTITAADGAQQAAGNGPFTFTGGTGHYDLSTHAVATTFQGSVRFTSKLHGFDIRLADVKVSTDAATKGVSGAITADVTAGGKTRDDVPLASLDLSKVRPESGAGGAMTFAKIPTKLTAQGAEAFNGMYQEGQELDPATLIVRPDGGGPGKPEQPGEPEKPGKPNQPGEPSKPSDDRRPSPTPTDKPSTGAKPQSESGSGSGSTAPRNPGTVYDGNLDWGVKKKFRDYVNGPIAHGKAELSGGTTPTASGYRFPKGHGTRDAQKAMLAAEFNGAVRFTGHGGALDLTFSNLRIKASNGKGTLIADVASKPRSADGNAPTKVVDTPNTAIADLKLPSGALTATRGVITLKNIPATLTAAGSKAFSGMYPAGEPLDPVNASLAVDSNAQLPSPATGSAGTTDADASPGPVSADGTGGAPGAASFTSGNTAGGTASLAATGSALPTAPLLGTAAALVVTGVATAYATRRRGATAR